MSSVLPEQITNHLEKFGLDPIAASWVLKALHPASVTACSGIPDETYIDVIRPDYRCEVVVNPPAGGVPWDCLIWRPGGNVNAFIAVTGAAGVDFRNAAAAALTCTVVPMEATTYINSDLQTYIPITGFVPFGVQQPVSRPLAFRTQYAGLTAYLTASALNDQGTVFAGQFDRPIRNSVYQTASTPLSVNGNSSMFSSGMTSVPFHENDMTVADPQMYTAQAREGVYMPLRLSGLDVGFRHGCPNYGSSMVLTGIGVATVTPFQVSGALYAGPLPVVAFNGSSADFDALASITSAGLVTLASPGSPYVFSGVKSGRFDFDFDSLAQGVIIFRGLSPLATITVKAFVGLEAIPSATSSQLVFTRPPASFSPRALEAYFSMVQATPDCYPASYNSLGTILSTIGSAASALWPTIRSIGGAIVNGLDAATGYKSSAPPLITAPTIKTGSGLEQRNLLAVRRPLSRSSVVVQPTQRARSRSVSVRPRAIVMAPRRNKQPRARARRSGSVNGAAGFLGRRF